MMLYDGWLDPTTTNLLRARELLADPEAWCKGYARVFRSPESMERRYCVVAAVLDTGQEIPNSCALSRLTDSMPPNFHSIVSYNDHPDRTHGEIMQWFDRAIDASIN